MASGLSFSGSADDISFDDSGTEPGMVPIEREPVQYGPDPHMTANQFLPDENLYKRLMAINDITSLKTWITSVYSKICGYDYFKTMLVRFLKENDPNVPVDESQNPAVIISFLEKYFDDLKRKYATFNLSFSKVNILEGSELGKQAQFFTERIMDELERNMQLVAHLREEIFQIGIENRNLLAENKALRTQMAAMKVENLGDVSLPDDFLNEMQVELRKRENLQSSLREEVVREKFIIQRMEKRLFDLQKEILALNQGNIDEVARQAKDLELEYKVRTAILEKIQTLKVDPKMSEKAVDNWMNEINKTVGKKREEIENMKHMRIQLDDEVAEKELTLARVLLERDELDLEILRNQDLLEIKKQENDWIKMQYENVAGATESIQENILQQSLDSSGTTFGSTGSSGYLDRSFSPPGLLESPEVRRGICHSSGMGSPDDFRPPGLFDHSSPISLDSSGSPGSPYPPIITVTPPSPHLTSPESISPPDLSEHAAIVAAGTQTISKPQSRLHPSTQTISGVSSRFDIGKGINMQTVTKGTPEPYHQATRVDSTLPIPGTSRMSDTPFTLKHRAELTPSQFVTPFISTTRFGYTDPTAKVLNLPPGDDLDIGTSLRKTLLLTSPYREQPLLVNIDVDPKPLTLSASGEHFICDISLDVQNTGEQQSVFTYGVPPAITPSTARRHTPRQHTPRGIFKKKHFNVRKLYGPDYESPDMPSHYFPYDSRSPITGFPPSPVYEDKSISWEKSSDFGTSVMDRTFDAPSPSALNRTFDRSSPSALDKTFDKSQSPVLDRTFDKSPYPALDRTYDRSPSPALDRTYDRSPSPVLDRTYDRSPSPAFDRTYDSSLSPALDRTYDSSISPAFDRTYDSSLSPALDRTYDSSPSPVIKRPIYADLSPDSSSGMSESPVIERPFYGSQSPDGSSNFSSSSFSPSSSSPPVALIKGKVYTYGVPPAITATTSRRHGPFTPRGIFKKKHYNVRRLYGSDYLSPDMPSNYLPFHSRSPITGFPPSPPYYGDKSISWERSSDQDTFDENLKDLTSDKSPSPLIKGKVYTYGVPPAITATTSRRHGPFTPRGIFKKQHYNVRRLYGSDYLSPEMPSHYLPFHSRSPITGFPPSPPYYGDKSISWERSSDQDTLDESLMELTSDESPSPHYRHRDSPYPVIKGPFYRYESPTSDSVSPVIKRPFHQSPDSSPSPQFDRTFDSSPSPMIKRTYYGSPSSGGSSDKSLSPMINRTFDSSPAYDSSSDRSASPRFDSTFDSSGSSRLDGTFDRSPSPQLDNTFDRSTSPRLNEAIDRSPSPQSNRTFDRSPQLNTTFDRNISPQLNRTFETSPPDVTNRTFDSTSSSQGSSPTGQLNRTFDSSSSNQSKG